MRDEARRILLAAATLCAAGCAQSEFQITGQNQGNMRKAPDSAIANAPVEKPPKILPETHFAAGMLFERQGQFDRALLQYRKAVALNSNYVAAFHRLGLLQSATGQHVEAVNSLQRAVALRPDNAVLHNDLGFEWMHIQQWENAEGELRRAIELRPDLATAHVNLGMALAKAERFSESLASFQAVLPEADAYYNLGLMYQGQQRYAEAGEAFRHVLTIDPAFSAANSQLERLAAGEGPPASVEAVEAVAETPQLEPVDDQVPVVTGDTTSLIAGPEFIKGDRAVECRHDWDTKLADLAAMLTIIDANKNWVRPIDRPTAKEEAVAEASDQELIEEGLQDSYTAAGDQVLADKPVGKELMMPPVDSSIEETVESFGEFEYQEFAAFEFVEQAQAIAVTVGNAPPPAAEIGEEVQALDETVEISAPPAAGIVEEAQAIVETVRITEAPTPSWTLPDAPSWTLPPWSARLTVEEAQALDEAVEMAPSSSPEYFEDAPPVAVAAESAEPPTPCDVESEESNRDDLMAAPPPAPITTPMRARNSWAMIEELEAKVVMLRYETKATKKKLVSATWP